MIIVVCPSFVSSTVEKQKQETQFVHVHTHTHERARVPIDDQPVLSFHCNGQLPYFEHLLVQRFIHRCAYRCVIYMRTIQDLKKYLTVNTTSLFSLGKSLKKWGVFFSTLPQFICRMLRIQNNVHYHTTLENYFFPFPRINKINTGSGGRIIITTVGVGFAD